MRATIRVMGVMAALAFAAVPLMAQRGPGPAMGRGMMRGGPEAMARNPAAVVLEHREALELTADQVAALERFQAQLEEENGPRWKQMQEAFGGAEPMEMTVEERQALRDRMRELDPVREEIRETNRAVMDQVHELLTEEQQTALHGIMQRRSGPQGRPGRGMRGRGPGDRAAGAAWRSGFRDGFTRGFRAARMHRPGR